MVAPIVGAPSLLVMVFVVNFVPSPWVCCLQLLMFTVLHSSYDQHL